MKSRRIAAAVTCAALLLIFCTLSWSAARTKSPTTDEPMHALAGWLWTHERDFRLDPEDPPLWGYWMSLPNGRDALRVDTSDPAWDAIAQTHWTQTPWWLRTLHDTSDNDADAMVRRSRRMALAIGVMLGVMIAWYAWNVAGPVAAVVAACLFAFDPNFLGHAPLVKNDVAIALVFLALSYAMWRAGTRLTWANAIAVALLCGVAMSVKFSGMLALPITGLLLLIRAMWPASLAVLRRTLETRGQRFVAAGSLFAVTVLVSVAVVWASYGFRYSAIADGSASMNFRLQRALAIKAEMRKDDPALQPTPQQLAATSPSSFVAAVVAINERRLMPEAWCNGLLYTYHTSLIRPSFLLGEVRLTGWWYYFPLAMAFKTPLATIAAAVVALVVARRGRQREAARDLTRWWTLLCLLLPPAIYFLVALRTNLNLGVRHVLPVYPPLFVAMGWALAQAWEPRGRLVRVATNVLALLLAIEALAAWPNYLAFFNVAAGGPRGGIRLLGDSNLDWGQDLPLLAKWQKAHPDRPIHLRYFGTADPADYVTAQRIDPLNPQMPAPPAVIAVSATYLQGLYVPDELRPFYESLRRLKPLAVLGGSIYIFEPPAGSAAPATTVPHSGQTPETLPDRS